METETRPRYDSEKFLEAYRKAVDRDASLTTEDVAVLRGVDADLAKRLVDKRLNPDEDPFALDPAFRQETREFLNKASHMAVFDAVIQCVRAVVINGFIEKSLWPVIWSHRHRIRDLDQRIDQLESNSPQAKSADPSLLKRIEHLEARLQAAEQRGLQDCGVWEPSKTYRRGDGVTSGGSFWIAQTDNPQGRPGSGAMWRLAVKKGSDGRDMR